jgi:hypothetical protein
MKMGMAARLFKNGIVEDGANRLCRLVVWLLVLTLSVGCTTLAYRYADKLLLWRIDHYFDLTADQRTFVRARLKDLLARHRHEALPVYERFLNEVKEKSADGLNREEVEWAFATYQDLRADLLERVIADSTVFLMSVDDRQIQHLEEAFRHDNEKADRRVQETAEKRLAKRAADTIDWLKDWLGPLTAEQKQYIAALSRALPDMLKMRTDYQKRQQQEVLSLLRSSRRPEVISQQLRDWLLFPEQSAPAEYRQTFGQMKSAVKEMILSIDRIITSQQRLHALAKLQGLIDDLRALASS